MKINPNDPWYPRRFKLIEKCSHDIMGGCPACLGVTIQLHLAEAAMQAIIASCGRSYDMELETRRTIIYDAEVMANELITRLNKPDTMIERANRDERKHDDGTPL